LSGSNPLEDLTTGSELIDQLVGAGIPGLWPSPAQKVDGSKLEPGKKNQDWKARYAKFSIQDETGDRYLEEIMTKVLRGEFVFGSEVSTFDKFGNAYVLVKWYEPVPKKKKKGEAKS